MTTPAGSAPKKTPLYQRHVDLHAKVIDFGGWAMPVQYSGILDEHKAVRSAAGLFDVSHMGEVFLRGPRAGEAVQRLCTNDIGKLADGGAQYNIVCLPSGGIVDDCIVYRVKSDEYLIVVNASNIDKDVQWFRENVGAMCTVEDKSDDLALLAVQGPRAVALVQSLAEDDVASLHSFRFAETRVCGVRARVARTGYTGEDGFEIFTPAPMAVQLWDGLLERGAAVGLKPIGLGARDTLRLEAKLSLYGNDIDAEHTPHEAGLSWVVKGKGYIGEEALAKQKAAGLQRKLVGFVAEERGIPRHGYPIYGASGVDERGAAVGVVTSGTTGPTVGVAVGMGYVPSALAAAGTRLTVDCRGKPAAVRVVAGPFYKRDQGPLVGPQAKKS